MKTKYCNVATLRHWNVAQEARRSITILVPGPFHGLIVPVFAFVVCLGSLFGLDDSCFAQCCPPVITNQPQSQSVIVGSTVNFSVGVNSTTFPSYHWRFNGTNIAGATGSNYTIFNAKLTNAGSYSVAVTNAAGWTISSNASLTVLLPSSVVAWGNNSYSQTNVPPGLSNAVAISAGYVHSLALRSDRTVSGWGYTNDARASIPSGL